MATSDKTKSSGEMPPDLLPIIRKSGVLTDRQFAEVRSKVLAGEYPADARTLAAALVGEKILTDFQAQRFLASKSHGLTVGRYVILDRLGSGSMGRVYRAHHLLMGRVVALKVIAPEIAQNARVVARFQREIRLVGRLDHPNVVRAFDADQSGSMLYIVMEYVPGQSLSVRFRTKGRFSPTQVVDYAAQSALGLAHAHAQGIVHRDIKPSNLLLGEDGQIKILDLGLGALMEADQEATFATADGIAVGTVDYMSPEQATGRDADGRSDLYSLGCAMYHLVSGKVPFPGESPIERLGKRISGRPVPILEVRPDVPASLVRVLDKLMAHRPADRYQTANEAHEALQALGRRSKPAAPAPRVPAPMPVAAPPLAPEVVEVEIEVEPDYPGWFRPLASLAARTPLGALLALAGGLVVAFAVGFGLAKLAF